MLFVDFVNIFRYTFVLLKDKSDKDKRRRWIGSEVRGREKEKGREIKKGKERGWPTAYFPTPYHINLSNQVF